MSKRILIIGPAWVGDMVIAQSLFKLLHTKYENLVLDVAAPPWTFPLLARMKEVNQGILLDFQHGKLQLRERYQLGRKLKKNHYDEAIVLPHSLKAALVPWCAQIPRRIGYLGEHRYLLLNDIRKLKSKHEGLLVNQYLALGLDKREALPKHIEYPLLLHSKVNRETDERPILALAPGAAFGDAKCWGVENYARIARHQLKAGWSVWLFGSEKDRAITNGIMALTDGKCRNLAGQLKLTETIDLLATATGLITNDSGLMHIAAALQKPLIALYGPTSPKFTPPLSDKATILQLSLPCQPCFARSCPLSHHHCMRQLTPDKVLPHLLSWN